MHLISFVLRYCALLLVTLYLVACSQPDKSLLQQKSKTNELVLDEASRQFITVEAVHSRASSLSGYFPGRIAFKPQAMTVVDSPVTARILSINVRAGEFVKAGSPLVTLHSADVAAARAALNQAKARNEAAEDLLHRQNEMIRKGVGLEVERFNAETLLREARAELERASNAAELFGDDKGDRFVLRAPANGVILNIKASVGSMVSPGDEALVTLGDPGELWVIADVAESEIGNIAVGQSGSIYIPGVNIRLNAVIDSIGRVVNEDQHRVPVYLAFKEPFKHLSAGMLAEVQLNVINDATRLSLPTTAVLIKDGHQQIVYVQQADGVYEPRPVRIGNSYGNRVIVLEGLQAGEKVVVNGALLLDSVAEQLL